MIEDPFKKNKPAFDPTDIDKIEFRKDLEEESRYLENQRSADKNTPEDNTRDVSPGLLSELMEDTDPQAQ